MLKDNVNRQIKQLTHLERKLKLFMAKGPAYHYTYGCWRLNRWLNGSLAKVHALNDQMFVAQFDLEEPGLSGVKKAVLTGNYPGAQIHLRTYFQARTTPCFFFEPGEITQICSLIDPNERDITIRRADEICQNIFRFRQVGPVKFEDGIDWTYRPHGNIDWTWDLNRHSYFETLGRAYWYTGNEQYAQKFRELLLDWLAKNPVSLKQPNWASVFEVAFRINTWIWAFYYFRTAAAFDNKTCLALLKGLLTHGHYLDTFLELHVQNNHLLLEAKALAMLGLLFPEFKLAQKWRHHGLRILYQQIQAQVGSDGVHGELATHYHRVIAGELVELLVLLENNETPISPEILATFDRMVEFELWITKPNSLPPLFGDSALEDTHLRFSAASGGPVFLKRHDLKSVAPPLDEANIWLLGYKRVRQYLDLPATPGCLPSRAFPEGGYFVMRSGQGSVASYLAFDCGPFGYKPAPNHGHADALSFELHALGQTLLLDPGVYSTHLGGDWRPQRV
ncbi:MAG: alginate lyase family protein [Chloroflexi bacterium]|nr:alginate lyase family protein [Chloroflexota bacterium]